MLLDYGKDWVYIRENWTPEELSLLLARREDRLKAESRARRNVKTEAEYFGDE